MKTTLLKKRPHAPRSAGVLARSEGRTENEFQNAASFSTTVACCARGRAHSGRIWPSALVLLIALATTNLVSGKDAITSAPSRNDFLSFRLITERNIFNPNRSGRSEVKTIVLAEPERRVRTERFALLGTMSYEKGRYAFFDGSSSDFRKVAKPEDMIAGFKISEVAPTCVKLEMTNGQILELCVGMQLKKRDDEPWELAGKADAAEGASRASSSTNNSATSASGPESEDILKRLLERRGQEGAPPATEAVSSPVVEKARTEEVKAAPAPGEADDILKKLLEKREQELNK